MASRRALASEVISTMASPPARRPGPARGRRRRRGVAAEAGDGLERVIELEVVDSLGLELLGRHREAGIGLGVVLDDVVGDGDLVDQVAPEIRLAKLRPGLEVRIGELRNLDVGLDPAFLDRATGRRVVARRGEAERRLRGERNQSLDRALAEAALAHDEGSV